jgi:hypothetical protein
MHEAVRERIDMLKQSTHADSMAEVIRRALAVYALLYQETAAGGKIVVRHGSRETEIRIPEYQD